MGLLTTWGAANRVTTSGLVRKYWISTSTMTLTGTSTDEGGNETTSTRDVLVYVISRGITKSYSYVGMDYAAAKSCAAEMLSRYTRETWVENAPNTANDEGSIHGTVTQCVAEISITPSGGGMYSVDVSVNMEDSLQRLTLTDGAALSSYFAAIEDSYFEED